MGGERNAGTSGNARASLNRRSDRRNRPNPDWHRNLPRRTSLLRTINLASNGRLTVIVAGIETMTQDIYQNVTDQLVRMIEAGAGAWRMPWHTDTASLASLPVSMPHNVTGRAYRGINVPILWGAANHNGYARQFGRHTSNGPIGRTSKKRREIHNDHFLEIIRGKEQRNGRR
jgi:hypothetical protein